MPFQIVRNDITKMNTEAVVNTANEHPVVGTGCDYAIYQAAGREQLLAYRREHIGDVPEGEVFLTPGFDLPAKYIIHAVSPCYEDGSQGEEGKLRSCYRKSLALAKEKGITSIAFPLIATGGFGYPKEEGMRIAVDEIHAFLLKQEMQIYLVVFGGDDTRLGEKLYPDLESYIDRNYVEQKYIEEYTSLPRQSYSASMMPVGNVAPGESSKRRRREGKGFPKIFRNDQKQQSYGNREQDAEYTEKLMSPAPSAEQSADDYRTVFAATDADYDQAVTELEEKLAERMSHMSDTFSEYLLYLIASRNMTNAEVWKRGIVDKKVFSKIKNNPDYHPNKKTALCLCIGAQLSLDESRDLLARAGYALSPCDKTDIIFSYFLENEIYDMIGLDIQLEEHGEPCIIS